MSNRGRVVRLFAIAVLVGIVVLAAVPLVRHPSRSRRGSSCQAVTFRRRSRLRYRAASFPRHRGLYPSSIRALPGHSSVRSRQGDTATASCTIRRTTGPSCSADTPAKGGRLRFWRTHGPTSTHRMSGQTSAPRSGHPPERVLAWCTTHVQTASSCLVELSKGATWSAKRLGSSMWRMTHGRT